MQLIVREDMFAHKLMAMHERISKTSRDIFDVWFFSRNDWPINKAIVEQGSGMPYRAPLQKCIAQLETTSDRNILSGLGNSSLTARNPG